MEESKNTAVKKRPQKTILNFVLYFFAIVLGSILFGTFDNLSQYEPQMNFNSLRKILPVKSNTSSVRETEPMKANISVSSSPEQNPILDSVKVHQSDNGICSKKLLLLLTTGRSGSTTLMAILHSLPRITMYGENDIRFLRAVAYSDVYRRPRGDAWFKNQSRMEEIVAATNSYIFAYYGYDNSRNDKYFGFKQLLQRVLRDDEPVFGALKKLNALARYFPCVRFILNYRNDVKAQKASQSRDWQSGMAEEKLAQLNGILSTFGKERKDAFDIPLEEFSLEKLNGMIKWLGYPECTLNSVPRVGTVSTPGVSAQRVNKITSDIFNCGELSHDPPKPM